MKSISKLKDEARRHEQREEWEKAIQAYLQVLRIADEGETEVELPLYNRLGDLCVRLGKPQEAVRHYEQAADRYAEAGLYNNAIALCNKALRYSPDRLELIRKLGQFSASQGFITDARRYFLDYAERQFNAGKVTDALNALEDFANVSDDADVRELLGRQLQAHGRINDAVDELRRAHALRLRDGQTEQAAALRNEILAIDPQARMDDGAPAPSGAPRPADTTDLPGLVEIEPERQDIAFEDAGRTDVAGLETGALTGEGADGVAAADLPGLETTEQPDELSEIDFAAAEGIEGLETTSFDFGDVEADTPVLEDLGLEREETSFDGQAGFPEAGSFDLPTLDDPAGGFDLPTLDEPEVDLPLLDAPEAAAELPTLDEPQQTRDVPTRNRGGIVELGDDEGTAVDLPLLGDDEPPAVDDEATPATPPQIDDPSALDTPGDLPDFGLGGDLPLDLSSLGGGMFDLTPSAEESDKPAWTTDDTSFDIPDLDDDALGLSTWEPEPEPEPEPDTTFDLPSFETEAEEPAASKETPPLEVSGTGPPPVETQPAEPESAEPAGLEAPDVAGQDVTAEADEATAEPTIRVPSIELPTWDTGILSGDDVDTGSDASDVDPTEPAWVDSLTGEEDDISADLPTFTYEDDISAEADVASIEEDEEETIEPGTAADLTAGPPQAALADADEDPLGLAAHLAGMTSRSTPADRPPGTRVPAPAEQLPREQATPDEPADWLDDIADDAADQSVAEAPGDAGEPAASPDEAGLDGETSSGQAAAPAASLEDAAAAAESADQAAREMAAAPPPEAARPPAAPPGRDEYIDLGAFIASDGEEKTTRFRVEESAPTGDEDRDFAELLSQFKSKVHEHLPPEDAGAHYDLGLAFKEMGLIDEAIGEFQIALRAGHMRLRVCEELGQCFLQKEQFNIAEKVLSRALTMKFNDELELLGVYYHLGRAYEALGRRDQARDAYERVLGMDINFGDVTDRLARL